MSNIKNSTVRLLAYTMLVGGLLFISAISVFWLWNSVLLTFFSIPEINLLESCGLVSFALVLLFAVKYANSTDDNLSVSKLPKIHTCVKLTDEAQCQRSASSDIRNRSRNLTQDQKNQLRNAILRYCHLSSQEMDELQRQSSRIK